MRIRSSRQGRRYAAIPNAALRDQRVSIEARGVLALLMSYSDSWVFQKAQLMEVTCLGRDKFERVMRELQDAGYVTLEAVRGTRGRLEGTRWFILDEPDQGDDSADSDAAEQAPDNSALPEGNGPSSSSEHVENAASHRGPEKPGLGDAHRGPEKPGLGDAHRGPEKPGPGKSGCIRRPKDKKTKRTPIPPEGAGRVGSENPIEDQAAASEVPAESTSTAPELFDAFWDAYPDPVERRAAEAAWGKSLGQGADPTVIIAAARAYASSREVGRGYVMKPANFLGRGRWQDAPVARPSPIAPATTARPDEATLDQVLRIHADTILAGRYLSPVALKPHQARRMIALGLVSSADLRARGISH